MNTLIKRAGLVSAVVALAAAGACSGDKAELDPSLKADLAAIGAGAASDLELAPNSARSAMVVSAIEGGPQAAPKPAAKARTTNPAPKKDSPAPVRQAPMTQPTVVAAEPDAQPTPAPEPQQPAMQAPRRTPAAAQQQDRRVYKTEAEIFRQMPWIRP